MGCPPENTFNVSCARFKKDFKILNLGVHSDFFLHLVDQYIGNSNIVDEAISKLFPLWILSYVTSFRIETTTKTFRSDYTIPQLIMLALSRRKIKGVAYYSKHSKSESFAFPVCVNLALLADYNGEEILSEMCRDIELIDPVNYSEFRQIKRLSSRDRCELFIETYYGKYALIAGRGIPYRDTSFFSFDRYLCRLMKDQFN